MVIKLFNQPVVTLYIIESAFRDAPGPGMMGEFMQQDFLLIRKMKNGDDAAMDVFIRRYYAQILQFCSYYGIGRAWAEDLTQETFERFFRKLTEHSRFVIRNYGHTRAMEEPQFKRYGDRRSVLFFHQADL